jgi:signal transduction histidine kinase
MFGRFRDGGPRLPPGFVASLLLSFSDARAARRAAWIHCGLACAALAVTTPSRAFAAVPLPADRLAAPVADGERIAGKGRSEDRVVEAVLAAAVAELRGRQAGSASADGADEEPRDPASGAAEEDPEAEHRSVPVGAPRQALGGASADDPQTAWAEQRLEELRARGFERVTPEECAAFVDELRDRDAGAWLGEALIVQGFAAMHAGELEAALNDWQEAARHGALWGRLDTLARAQNAIGIGLRHSGDSVGARNRFELAVSYAQGVDARGYRVNLAGSEMALGNLGRAFDQFASVVHELSDAQACIAYHNMSGICLTAELFEAALRLSRESLDCYARAGDSVEQIAGLSIGVQLQLHHAECLTSVGDREGAAAALERAGVAQQSLDALPPSSRKELLTRRASIELLGGRFQEALELLEPLTRDLRRPGRAPSYLDPHVQRLWATGLHGVGRSREALDVLDEVDPSRVAAGSHLEFDLNELRMSLLAGLVQPLDLVAPGADSALLGSEARAPRIPGNPRLGLPAQAVLAGDSRGAERNRERRDWRDAERSIIRANFARPELAPLLGDLLATQGASGSEPGAVSGQKIRSSRPAALAALCVAGLLAVASLVLCQRSKRRAQKVLQLESLVEELRIQRREVADRAAAVSHDLRGPVMALRCCLDLLGLDESSPNVRSRIEPMRRGLDHIIQLADDSLLLHRLAGGGDLEEVEPCDLVRTLSPVVDLWRPLAANKHLELRFHVPPGVHAWSIHADHAVRLLENLLSNAVKFSRGPGVIDVRLERQLGHGSLSVTDCGPGVPPSELPRLFEPMARLSPQPTDGEVSYGLGTSIVRALAESWGGRVEAANGAGGKGLCVTIHWPAATGTRSVRPRSACASAAGEVAGECAGERARGGAEARAAEAGRTAE